MQRFYASAALLTALVLIASQDGQVLAASPSTTQTPEKTVPQGTDPPGADDGVHSSTRHKGVITPPKTGDEGIYTQAPNPNAGTNEEVIPPPGTAGSEHPNVEPR